MMQNPPPLPAARRKKPRSWGMYLGVVAAVFVVAAVISFSIWRWRLHQEVKGRVAAIRAQGLPVNWDDLSRWPSVVPDAENEAFIYTNAIAHLHLEHLTDRPVELLGRNEVLSSSNLSLITQTVETNQAGLEIIYSALKFSRSRYISDYSDGYGTKLPYLRGLKSTGFLLSYQAFLRAKAGDADGAAKAVEASFHTAGSLEGDPTLIAQFVDRAVLAMSCTSLERVTCRLPLSEESLARLSSEISAADATNRYLTGLIGERALAGEYLRLASEDVRKFIAAANQGVDEGDQAKVPRRDPGSGFRYLGFFERDRNFYLRAMETNISIVKMSPPVSSSMTDEAEKLRQQALSGYYVLSSTFLSSIPQMAERVASLNAILRTALAAVAVERWRLGHDGAIPDSLDVLVPAFLPSVPIDPYDGKPLKFKKTPKGYVVYSIGPDLHDDSGKEQLPKKLRKLKDLYDITFTVER
jgi:hypothetical protein